MTSWPSMKNAMDSSYGLSRSLSATDITRSFSLIVQLHCLIHIGKWTKLFRQVTLQVK